MADTYEDIVRGFGLEIDLRGPWAVVGRTEREQGWKLHVSSVPVQAPRLLGVLVPLLRDRGVSFKLARDEATLFLLNEGALGPTQIGKFVTIYPESDAASRQLAEELVACTGAFEGPVVTTDRRLGSVVYARYGGFNPAVRRDRLGQTFSVLRGPDGSFRLDSYSVPFVPPPDLPDPFTEFSARHQPDPPPAGSGKLFGPGYLLLETLKPNPKGSVFLALDLRRREHVAPKVIKEGRRHCVSDRFGRDIRDRLQHQAAIHCVLAGRVPLPAAESCFEVAGNAYLVLEHVAGEDLGAHLHAPYGSLSRAEQHQLLAQLRELVAAVQRLHAAGYVHRDLAPSNVRVRPDGSICLLDFELAHDLRSDAAPYSQGTPGFMSPQQQTGRPPTFADDVFAVGALLVFLLSGLDPRRVLFAIERGRAHQLRELTGAPIELVEVVAQCLATEPAARPALADLRRVLAQRLSAISPSAAPTDPPRRVSPGAWPVADRRTAVGDQLAAAACGLLHDVLLDEATGLWLSPLVHSGAHAASAAASGYAIYRSASRGVAGVVYTLARLARVGIVARGTRARVERAVDWLLAHAATEDDQLPGLHFGEAGVALAIAETVRAGLIPRGGWLDSYLAEALHGPLDWPDLTHGAAGQGIAALACADLLDETQLADLAHRCADYLLTTQDADGGWTLPDGVEAMTGARYTGFAHGVAGPVYFLTEYSARFDRPAATRAAQLGAEWLTRRAICAEGPEPTVAWPMKDGDDERWRWWCHGGPGIALAYLKLFERTRDARYSELARQALRAHPLEVRYSNLSQCHGVSGLGEIYLEAARVLGDEVWLERAARVGHLLLQLAREGDTGGLTWLVEDPYKATADLMVGSGGVAHLLLRLSDRAPGLGPPLLPDHRVREPDRRMSSGHGPA